MKHQTDIRALLRHVESAGDLVRWLREEGDALIAAAELLGGSRWSQRASTIVKAARDGRDISIYRPGLASLRRLLHLELVDDPTSFEAARFAALHPDDPRADRARLCAEVLDRGVRSLEALWLAGMTGKGLAQ